MVASSHCFGPEVRQIIRDTRARDRGCSPPVVRKQREAQDLALKGIPSPQQFTSSIQAPPITVSTSSQSSAQL